MYCKNLKKKIINSSQNKPILICKLTGDEIIYLDCKKCLKRNLASNKGIQIKKKTTKLQKLEKNRFSILTDNLEQCYFCGKPKDDLNEIFSGSNRKKSMEWGCVIPLCRECHRIWHREKSIRQKYYDICRNKYVELYGFEKFMKEFKKSYKE